MSNAKAQQAGIGLIELRELAGAANVDGSGVNLLQVEAGTLIRDADGNPIGINYSPEDPDYNQLDTKTFEEFGNIPSLGNAQGHARSVAQEIFGYLGSRPPNAQFGSAPAIGSSGNPTIKILSAFELLESTLGSGFATPVAQNFDVSNHSYVVNLNPSNDFDEAAAVEKLRRMDYTINSGNMTAVVGSSNSPNGVLPALFVQAYNTINVGVSDGGHGFGPTTLNGAGRNSIHVTVDHAFTSFATPRVSGAAAILHQTGAGTEAVKQEVIKATILAGATKDDLVDADGNSIAWSHTQTQPLDLRYGAGELNVLNNHLIQQAGEINGGATSTTATPAGINGWDYESLLAANDERFYEFTVDSLDAVEDFSIALTWNLEVVDGSFSPFSFIAEANDLADLSLELTDLSDNSIVDLSDSSVDNVEHIFIPSLPAGTYQLRVGNGSTNVDTDYGLAFRGVVVDAVLLGDSNLDGVVDFFDIAPMIGLMTSGTYLEQADCNEDGVVDFFDIAPFLQIVAAS